MFTIDCEVTINRPVEAVFAYVLDNANIPRWQPATIEQRQTSEGPPGVGTTGILVRRVLGQRLETTWEVTAFVPNQRFSVKSTSGPVSFQATYTFQPVDGGTRLQRHFEGEPKGFFRVAEPVLAGSIRKEFTEDLARLKAILES